MIVLARNPYQLLVRASSIVSAFFSSSSLMSR